MSDDPRRVPRFLSCLIKGPAGCLAFVIGAVAVLVLLLPAAGGRLVDRSLESWFADKHEGELELADAWLGSLWGVNRVERLILRDPGGDEVLRASLRAPELGPALDGPLHRYGPVHLRIEALHLVLGADGTSNLERALAPRVDEQRRWNWKTDVPFEIRVEVVVERMRYTTSLGAEAQLEDLRLDGTLQWGPQATRLVLQGASPGDLAPMTLSLELTRTVFDTEWDVRLSTQGVPTVLARTLCPAMRPLTGLLGPRIDRLAWTREGVEVAMEVEDEGARLDLRGLIAGDVVQDAEGGVLRGGLLCGERASELLARLLPVFASVECLDPEASHALRLVDYRWPLDGATDGLAGILEVLPAPSRCALLPGVRAWLGDPAGGAVQLASEPLTLRLAGGALVYEGFELPRGVGRIVLDGVVPLGGDVELDMRTDTAEGEVRGRLVGSIGELLPLPEEEPDPLDPMPAVPPVPAGPPVDGR